MVGLLLALILPDSVPISVVQSIDSMSHQLLTAEQLEESNIAQIWKEIYWVYKQEPTTEIKAYIRLCFDILSPKVFELERMGLKITRPLDCDD